MMKKSTNIWNSFLIIENILSEETTIRTLRLNLSYIGPNHIEDHASDHAALMQFL